jgi:hypothetical protein
MLMNFKQPIKRASRSRNAMTIVATAAHATMSPMSNLLKHEKIALLSDAFRRRQDPDDRRSQRTARHGESAGALYGCRAQLTLFELKDDHRPATQQQQ